MAEGMPYYKPHKSPVESSDESLEDIEKQACLLFEEFLRLAPVPSAGLKRHANFEQSDYFAGKLQGNSVRVCNDLVQFKKNHSGQYIKC